MFRQEERAHSIEEDSDQIALKAEIIRLQEEKIDPDDKIYLMTWSPDPKQIPDCDFINQHLYCMPYVESYLSFCKSGCACVESSQIGNPHYHTWVS